MNRLPTLPLIALTAFFLGCDPPIDDSNFNWIGTLKSPEPVVGVDGLTASIDWCPQLLFPQFGLPIADECLDPEADGFFNCQANLFACSGIGDTTCGNIPQAQVPAIHSFKAIAPTNIPATLTLEDEDVYTLVPQTDFTFYGGAIEFDTGPLGTFYSKRNLEYPLTGIDPATGLPPTSVTPATVGVTRILVEGKVTDDTDFDLTLDYVFDCGETDAITATGGEPCACTTQRLTWNFLVGAPIF